MSQAPSFQEVAFSKETVGFLAKTLVSSVEQQEEKAIVATIIQLEILQNRVSRSSRDHLSNMTRKFEMLLDLSITSQFSSSHQPIRCTDHKSCYIWISIIISFKHLISTLFDLTFSFVFSTENLRSNNHLPALSFAALLWQVFSTELCFFFR